MSASQYLGSKGPFAKALPDFAPRAQQIDMADAVEVALANNQVLVCEAGTGIGKTFAYLVPALLSGRRVIVSTGTKTLQDQLYEKDLPLVRKALGVAVKTALLKGRANYLCRYRLEEGGDWRGLGREEMGQLGEIRVWSRMTRSGDIAEVRGVDENSRIWPRVTSTVDNCLGQECSAYDDCFVYEARREAQKADLVVINHHLLCADLGLKEEGFGDLLPVADAYIIDEAHQLPAVASNFFGQTLSSRQLLDLAQDSIDEQVGGAGDVPEIADKARALTRAVYDFRISMGQEGLQTSWKAITSKPSVKQGVEHVQQGLQALLDSLEPNAERSKGLDSCWHRCAELKQSLHQVTNPNDDAHIHWLDTFKRGFGIHMTPLDIAETYQQRLPEKPAAWVYTSATLAVGEKFDYFTRQLGLGEAKSQQLDSPFDYQRNALLYLPPQMPQPNEARYTQVVIDRALPVIRAAGGRCFMLFTSYRALRQAETELSQKLDYPVLVQGSAPKGQLLERFRELGNAVLLATASFWEGVDVRGDALSCVIIDKLPFASPGNPVLQARLDAMRANGTEPFMHYQLPRAVITLKQGVGRLIRDVSDRGVLMLCDPRLTSKAYGRVFLNSLPDMPRSNDIADVQAFFS